MTPDAHTPDALAPAVATVAALFVAPGGVYCDLPSVDLWTEARDARRYEGPHPVVAHPPCARWGKYARGGPSHHGRFEVGADGGCFASALAAVRRWGGVLEHPADSLAWAAHGLIAPPRSGGWVAAGDWIGWTCCVEQGHYGHRSRKPTWLYAVGCSLPSLRWGSSGQRVRPGTDHLCVAERRRVIKRGIVELLTKRERAATPVQFRDLLVVMARSADAATGRPQERPQTTGPVRPDMQDDGAPARGAGGRR